MKGLKRILLAGLILTPGIVASYKLSRAHNLKCEMRETISIYEGAIKIASNEDGLPGLSREDLNQFFQYLEMPHRFRGTFTAYFVKPENPNEVQVFEQISEIKQNQNELRVQMIHIASIKKSKLEQYISEKTPL